MDDKIVFLFCLLGCIYSGDGASAPFIEKCKWDDSKCMKKTTQAAIPIFAAGIRDLGVETLEPLTMKQLNASSPQLSLILKDGTATGLKNCVAKSIKRDIEKSKILVKILCTVDLKAKYEMKGQLLLLPIEGKGDAHVFLNNMELSVDLDMDVKTQGGEKYWFIKDFEYTYKLKDKSLIELDNLFGGNEVLGRAAKELIAGSSNEIIVEVGSPIVKAVTSKIVDNVNNFFSKVPLAELELTD